MKNICFISMGNLYMVPYLNTYIRLISNRYSVIYWDREDKNEESEQNTYYRFLKKINGNNKLQKAIGYLQFRNYAKKILKKNKFDVIVLLQTWSSIILSDVLCTEYRHRYILDIRDYTYEKNKFIFFIEKLVINRSMKTIISSEGYKVFLPTYEYLIVHNIRNLSIDIVNEISLRKKERKTIHIAFIGYVNYQEQQKKIILSLKNDIRFKLSFIGTRALELATFCIENNVRNVCLEDTFDSSKILDYYSDVDMINNLYGNKTPVLDYALSNKLYFAAEFRMPILVYKDTFMAKLVDEYGIGLSLNMDETFLADTIWNYYTNINWDKLYSGCNKFLAKAKTEQQNFELQIKGFLT